MGTAVSEMKLESPSLIDKLLLTLNEITTVSSQISRNAAEKNGDLKLINCNLNWNTFVLFLIYWLLKVTASIFVANFIEYYYRLFDQLRVSWRIIECFFFCQNSSFRRFVCALKRDWNCGRLPVGRKALGPARKSIERFTKPHHQITSGNHFTRSCIYFGD